MDTLVARYSRPMFENEGYAKEQQEEMELVQEVPALSLKFAMPPVAQVSLCPCFSSSLMVQVVHLSRNNSMLTFVPIAIVMASRRN